MKISIITVAYNSASTIRDTLESIAKQGYPEIEHIIIDGKSKDDTLKIVSEFPHVSKVVSEPDKGLYDAMNKGLKQATGDIVGILNSDDVYNHTDVISKVMSAFVNQNVACIYGDLQYVKQNDLSKVVRTWRSGKFRYKKFLYGWMPPHPAFFVKREVYEKVGGFVTDLRSAADYEIMLRILYKHKYSCAYLPEVLVRMRTGGASNASIKNRLKANLEDRKAWKLIQKKPHFFTLYLKPLRKISQFIFK